MSAQENILPETIDERQPSREYLQELIDNADADVELYRELEGKEPLENIEVDELDNEEVEELIEEIENPEW